MRRTFGSSSDYDVPWSRACLASPFLLIFGAIFERTEERSSTNPVCPSARTVKCRRVIPQTARAWVRQRNFRQVSRGGLGVLLQLNRLAFNRFWMSLLALIPYVNISVMIQLGLKGRELSWRQKQWGSAKISIVYSNPRSAEATQNDA
jgi:hypothetical protein